MWCHRLNDNGQPTTPVSSKPHTYLMKCISKLHLKKIMEFPCFDPNTKLAAVYYNVGTPPHLFRIRNDVSLFELKDELDQINRHLNHRDTRRVVGGPLALCWPKTENMVLTSLSSFVKLV